MLACAGVGLAVAAGCGAYNRVYYGVVLSGVPYSGRMHRGLHPRMEALHGPLLEFYEERHQVGGSTFREPQQSNAAGLGGASASFPSNACSPTCCRTWSALSRAQASCCRAATSSWTG